MLKALLLALALCLTACGGSSEGSSTDTPAGNPSGSTQVSEPEDEKGLVPDDESTPDNEASPDDEGEQTDESGENEEQEPDKQLGDISTSGADYFERIRVFTQAISGFYHVREFGLVSGQYQGNYGNEFFVPADSNVIEAARRTADVIGDDFYCSYQEINGEQGCSSIKDDLLVTVAKRNNGFTRVEIVNRFDGVGIARGFFVLSDVSAARDRFVTTSALDLGDQGLIAPDIAGDWSVKKITVSRELGSGGVTVDSGSLNCSSESCQGMVALGGASGVSKHDYGFSGRVGNSRAEIASMTISPSGNIFVAVYRHPGDFSQVYALFGLRK